MLKAVSPFKTGPALEALRNEGHDFTSALGEAIDNSFGHGDATEVRIKLEWYPPVKSKRHLKEVHIADNGIGMDPIRLRDCLVLGFSTTYNKRDQIGRFGFGMTVGAIGQCRKIEVWSKAKNTDFHYVILDLDEFSNGKDMLDPPVKKKIPKEYELSVELKK
jgi:sensor histidine kinase regulating citrate/malate metabolism